MEEFNAAAQRVRDNKDNDIGAKLKEKQTDLYGLFK